MHPVHTSETQEEDEDIDMYEPEHEMQEGVHKPKTKVEEEPPVYVPEPVVPLSVAAAEAPAVRQSGQVRKKPDQYGFPPKVLHSTVKKGLQQYGDMIESSIMTELHQLGDKEVFTPLEA